jgi:hypothetical protein
MKRILVYLIDALLLVLTLVSVPLIREYIRLKDFAATFTVIGVTLVLAFLLGLSRIRLKRKKEIKTDLMQSEVLNSEESDVGQKYILILIYGLIAVLIGFILYAIFVFVI